MLLVNGNTADSADQTTRMDFLATNLLEKLKLEVHLKAPRGRQSMLRRTKQMIKQRGLQTSFNDSKHLNVYTLVSFWDSTRRKLQKLQVKTRHKNILNTRIYSKYHYF